MTTYESIAKITMGDSLQHQIRDLREGLENVIAELHERGWSIDDIERDVETALEGLRWPSG